MSKALLLYGATEPESPHFSPDMLWRTGFRAPDPFYCLILYSPSLSRGGQASSKTILLVSRLEYARAKKEARTDRVVLHEGPIAAFLKSERISRVRIPQSFPHGLAEELKKRVKVEIIGAASAKLRRADEVFPERARKTTWEVKEIEKAARAVGKAIDKARTILRKSDFRKSGKSDFVRFEGKVLTSEFLRDMIEGSLFADGYLASGTIVSSGKDTAYPHAAGKGPIIAHTPIILDIFPRSKTTNYYADITRTLFKSAPSEPMRRMYQAVLDAQEGAIKQVRAGVDASDVYKGVINLFEERGYPTVYSPPARQPVRQSFSVGGSFSDGGSGFEGSPEGFIHGLGHGVGLEIHENPRVGSAHSILEAGNVITIEPGLYYPVACHSRESGNPGQVAALIPQCGIRIEDMLLVTKTGYKVLSPIPKTLKWAVIP